MPILPAVLVTCLVWSTVAAAAGLAGVAVAKDNQPILFVALTVGLAVIAAAVTWRLFSVWKPGLNDSSG